MKALAAIACSALLLLAACKQDSRSVVEPPLRPVLSVVAVVRTTDTLGPFAGTIEPRYKTDFGFRSSGAWWPASPMSAPS